MRCAERRHGVPGAIASLVDAVRPRVKRIRTVHLYLGSIFTPMLILFAVTGAFQVFGLHADSVSLFGKLAAVHSLQSFGKDHISLPLKFLVFLMGISVITTSILGVMMAF